MRNAEKDAVDSEAEGRLVGKGRDRFLYLRTKTFLSQGCFCVRRRGERKITCAHNCLWWLTSGWETRAAGWFRRTPWIFDFMVLSPFSAPPIHKQPQLSQYLTEITISSVILNDADRLLALTVRRRIPRKRAHQQWEENRSEASKLTLKIAALHCVQRTKRQAPFHRFERLKNCATGLHFMKCKAAQHKVLSHY